MDHGWYIGYTTDLKKRLEAHNHHRNASTAQRGPWKLIYAEAYLEKMDALGREKFLKSGSGHRFVKKQLRHYLGNCKYGHYGHTTVLAQGDRAALPSSER